LILTSKWILFFFSYYFYDVRSWIPKKGANGACNLSSNDLPHINEIFRQMVVNDERFKISLIDRILDFLPSFYVSFFNFVWKFPTIFSFLAKKFIPIYPKFVFWQKLSDHNLHLNLNFEFSKKIKFFNKISSFLSKISSFSTKFRVFHQNFKFFIKISSFSYKFRVFLQNFEFSSKCRVLLQNFEFFINILSFSTKFRVFQQNFEFFQNANIQTHYETYSIARISYLSMSTPCYL